MYLYKYKTLGGVVVSFGGALLLLVFNEKEKHYLRSSKLKYKRKIKEIINDECKKQNTKIR